MRSQQRELTLNQWWETLSTIAKALFFFLVTPVLLRRLGTEGYGFLALALSAMACVLSFDFGLRIRLRIALSGLTAQTESTAGNRSLAEALGHYLGLLASFAALGAIVAASGLWQRWTRSDGHLLAVALLGSSACGFSMLLLEPLAARGRLSQVKASAFIGNALATPVVLGLVATGSSANGCFLGYALSLAIPNLGCALVFRSAELAALPRALGAISPAGLFRSIYAGRWFALTATESLLKSYLLTFLAGALLGPAAAGTYFILLKLSELVSVFGANASDTSTADLAALPDAPSRATNFRASYSYSAAMCLVAFAGLACLGPLVLGRWLQLPLNDPSLAILVGTFGLAASFHRVLLTACMGVALTHVAALWGLGEVAVILSGSVVLVPHIGVAGILVSGTLGSLALTPVALRIARHLGQSVWQVWALPLLGLIPGFVAAAGTAWLGGSFLPVGGFLIAITASAYRLRQLQISGALSINSRTSAEVRPPTCR